MKRLRKNSGFTLVECIVALAVLAVMTLGLMMILNASVKQRNSNMMLEQNIDKQVEQVVQGDSTTAMDIGDDVIELGGYKISGIQMVYLEDDETDLQIGALYYEGNGSLIEPDPENPGNPGTPEGPINAHNNNWKVYGALEVDSVTVGQNGNAVVNADGSYTLSWDISFNFSGEASAIKSVKVVLPSYAEIISTPTKVNGNCNVHKIGNNIVRIQPTDTWGGTFFKANVKFTVPASQYDAYVGDPGKFISDYFGKTEPGMFT